MENGLACNIQTMSAKHIKFKVIDCTVQIRPWYMAVFDGTVPVSTPTFVYRTSTVWISVGLNTDRNNIKYLGSYYKYCVPN